MKTFTRALALTALVALAIAAPSPAHASSDAPETAVVPAPPLETPAPEAAPTTPRESSTGTWVFMMRENCYDLWMRSCDQTFPNPQCPPNPAGQSCSPTGSSCWNVISSNTVEYYRCM